jgi:Dolichyl-phosphate-mannose-protein mannosyltransferase
MNMKTLESWRKWVVNYWQSALISLGLIVAPLTIILYNLSSTTKGVLLGSESVALTSAVSKQAIFNNPLDFLFKLPEYALVLLKTQQVFVIRLVPAMMGLITVLALYYVVRQWYGNKTALAILVLATTSSWFLGYARLATPDIVYPMLISLGLAYGAWIRKAKHSGLVMLSGVFLGLGYVYSGGLIWLAILAVVWQRKNILRHIADAPKFTVTILIIISVGVSPLILAAVKQPEIINQIAGISSNPSADISNLGIRSVDILQQLSVQGQKNPEVGLTNLAILDVFTYVMALLGLITLLAYRKLDRFKVVMSLLVGLWVIASLGGTVPVVVLMPIIYLLAAGGIGKLIGDWMKVFPRNPLARGIGLSVLTVAISLSSLYHLERYFIAWPKAPATQQVIADSITRSNVKQ